VATWGEERLRACDRTLALLPDFAPARFTSAMVFVARQAFGAALGAAEAGAAAQSRHIVHEGALFPSIGLHWLRGLLLLREGQLGGAVQAFARELDELGDAQIYASEFRVNAQVGAGFVHLAAGDPAGAVDAFRLALETFPRHGRALIGLGRAFRLTSLAGEVEQLSPQIDRAVAELVAAQRPGEAALLSAAAQVNRGDLDGAYESLQQLLEQAPHGQAGWLIPIDPALAPIRAHARFAELMALLAARAS
jgi:tetratricopeptide (TPR) repeat protein